jgi:purine-binding chemotaxis protein CheW
MSKERESENYMDKRLLDGMMITVSGRKVVLPISIIKHSFKTTADNITYDPDGDRMVTVNGDIKALVNLSDYLDLPSPEGSIEEQLVILMEDERRELCVVVDSLVGECQAAVEPMPPFCGDGEHISGCALLNGDELFLVVNHKGLFEGITPREPDTVQRPPPPPPETAAEPLEAEVDDRYLAFELCGEVYALHIAQVREIIGLCEIVPVPKTARVVEGIINRRGEIVPIINLCRLFSAAGKGNIEAASIIIMEHDDHSVGIMIDRVRETIKLAENSIKPLPQQKTAGENAFVSMMGRYEGSVILLLDWAKVAEALRQN